jgi:hypothetical protein
VGTVERAALLAAGIGTIVVSIQLLGCISQIGNRGFDMRACVLPAIPRIAIPNFELILFLVVVFAAVAYGSWQDDDGF